MALRYSRAFRQVGSALQQRSAGSIAFQRDSKFEAVSDADIRAFQDILGPGGLVTDQHDLQPYNR
jgi:hypothetical protein